MSNCSSDLLVESKASLMTTNPSEVSSQALTSAARQAEGSLTTGPLVMLSARILLRQPPLSCKRRGRGGGHQCARTRHEDTQFECSHTESALHPRLVLATRQPSVVARGT